MHFVRLAPACLPAQKCVLFLLVGGLLMGYVVPLKNVMLAVAKVWCVVTSTSSAEVEVCKIGLFRESFTPIAKHRTPIATSAHGG